jgi:hypothetical protein
MTNILAPAATIQQTQLKERLKAKRSSIRAIDKGTLYDIPGRLRHYARAIESGEMGDVRNAVLIISAFPDSTSSRQIRSFALGSDDRTEMHWMVSTVKNRTEPA